ncbi:MAG: hypothetical protein DRQ49_17750 [Gammaproteobacteria bacterium]|nr:MAG: hypothetical protein DRQ49_17750 [Gammaproteobacteria bacterium]RKZ76369.1 MAG: hypothetical protein DRQ57_04095 [Gammaproteobacteria bacterium]
MKIKIVGFFAIASLSLASFGGCQATMPSKQAMGTVGGAGMGAIIGSRFGKGEGRVAAVAVGTLLGAVAGSAIGASMDQSDTVKTQQALNTGEPVAWTNPNSKDQYTVTPVGNFTNSKGQNCRNYTTVAVIDGNRETLEGSACQQPDGTWKAEN